MGSEDPLWSQEVRGGRCSVNCAVTVCTRFLRAGLAFPPALNQPGWHLLWAQLHAGTFQGPNAAHIGTCALGASRLVAEAGVETHRSPGVDIVVRCGT